MDQSVRIVAAACVLLGGISLALLFRHKPPQNGPEVPDTGNQLVLRRHVEPPRDGQTMPGRRGAYHRQSVSTSAAGQAAGPMPTILTPGEPGEVPPTLAREYPAAVVTDSPRWGPSIRLPVTIRRQEPTRTHEIVDGDTLPALAERYLGSADRYRELYEANRDVLQSPELLEIGARLKIPPRHAPAQTGSDVKPRRPVVPVTPNPRAKDSPAADWP